MKEESTDVKIIFGFKKLQILFFTYNKLPGRVCVCLCVFWTFAFCVHFLFAGFALDLHVWVDSANRCVPLCVCVRFVLLHLVRLNVCVCVKTCELVCDSATQNLHFKAAL